MASSTSNSNCRLGAWPWIRTYLFGLLVAAVLIGGWEGYWRSRGLKAFVANNFEIWAAKLDAGLRAGPDAIMLTGSSRIMAAIHFPTLRAARPDRVLAQVGTAGGSPVAVLRYLAEETAWNGCVVVEVSPGALFIPFADQENDSAEWVERFTQRLREQSRIPEPTYHSLEFEFELYLKDNLVTFGGQTHPNSVLKSLVSGEPIEQPFFWLTRDRTEILDFTDVDMEDFRESRVARYSTRAMTKSEFAAMLVEPVQGWVRDIEARGGRVVLLRLPAKGGILRLENERFSEPRLLGRPRGARRRSGDRRQRLPGAERFPDDRLGAHRPGGGAAFHPEAPGDPAPRLLGVCAAERTTNTWHCCPPDLAHILTLGLDLGFRGQGHVGVLIRLPGVDRAGRTQASPRHPTMARICARVIEAARSTATASGT